MDRKALLGGLIATVVAVTGCNRSKPITVGSKNFTEQVVLGEILAQHLENRLKRKVNRRLNLGGTMLTYQALQAHDIDVYPEYTGTILSAILKEQPGGDANVVLERVRGEMLRTAQIAVLDPLGIDNTFVIVVRGEDARNRKLTSISDAAGVKQGWKLGVGYEFQERRDGYAALNGYRLTWAAPLRSMDLGLLYKALEEKQVTMVAANATDGVLAARDFQVLSDDKKVFPPYQACLLARADTLNREPGMRQALAELSGKFSNEMMRKLNYEVDGEHKQVKDVAAAFLRKAGLQ
jgi:glycine betaine/choline ABC-type transport system substrate-binding protein